MQSKGLHQKYSPGKHWENHPSQYAESFAAFLKKQRFMGRIVDIGCSDGRDVNVFSKHGFDALGVDNIKEEIDRNKKKFPQIPFQVDDVEHFSFKENSVDAFFMINVIHYVKKELAIQEILRTLKPNGYFFVHFNIEIIDKSGTIDYHHSESDILELINAFTIIEQRIFKRTDTEPVEHTHTIMELILQKKKKSQADS